jgi:hypothetical protein
LSVIPIVAVAVAVTIMITIMTPPVPIMVPVSVVIAVPIPVVTSAVVVIAILPRYGPQCCIGSAGRTVPYARSLSPNWEGHRNECSQDPKTLTHIQILLTNNESNLL